MRDGPAERAVLRLLHVDVDPLVVTGRVRELVHPLLGDLDPVGGADLLPGSGLDLLERTEHAHGRRSSWVRRSSTRSGCWMATVPNDSVQAVAGANLSRSPPRWSGLPPRSCCTTTSTAGCGPQTIVELAHEAGHTLPADDADVARAVVHRVRGQRLAGALPRDLRPHRGGDAARRPHHPGGPRVRRGPGRDGVVYAEVRYAPEQHLRGGLTLDEVVARGAARLRRGDGEPTGIDVRQLLTAMRHQARSREIAELAVQHRDHGRRRLRHRRRGGGLPAHPAPRRLRVPPARERPLHDPRRRGVRAAVDLAGDPVVRRRPARSRRTDHRRHHRRRRRDAAPGPARAVRARQADPARAVPALQRADRGGQLDRRAPDRAADQAAVPGHGEHRQPADERHLDEPRDAGAGRRVRLRPAPTCSGSRSTR